MEDIVLQVNAAVSISLKDRIAIYGHTGAGKTTFVYELLPRLWEAYPLVATNIIDSKGKYEYNHLATRLHIGPTAPAPAQPGEVVVWVIPGRVDKEQLDKFLQDVQATNAPAITVADEIANLKDGNGFVEGADLMLKQGRIGGQMFIGLAQEYAGNSRNLFGQATHVFRFYLQDTYDGRELNRKMGLPPQPGKEPLQPPAPFGFFYRRVDRPGPVLAYTGWQEFFRF